MRNKKHFALITLLIGIILSACGKGWAIRVTSTYGEKFTINEKMLEDYSYLKDSGSACEGIPLEVALYQHDIEVIDRIEILDADKNKYSLGNGEIIDGICINPAGSLTFGETELFPKEMFIEENDIVLDAGNIQDVPATAAYALDLDMEGLNGKSLAKNKYDHVVLIFMDGFSYSTYRQALKEKLIPNLLNRAHVYAAVTVYPPRTTTASASLITGLTPDDSGVYKSGIRSTESRTIFEAAVDKGLKVVAVEDETLPFDLPAADLVICKDSNQNGNTDEDVFAKAMELFENEKNVPNLVYIHFHGIDNMGHAYKPVTSPVLDKVVEVDGYCAKIFEVLPENTLVISFADHGMHIKPSEEEGGVGTGAHGNLIFSDMVIPIFVRSK